MRRTLDSVSRQSVPPDLWVVVDDGSTDETPAILAEYAPELPYLRVVRREDRGRRSVGPGVDRGVRRRLPTPSTLRDFDYLCKLDLDLELPPSYFEGLIRRMEAEPRLGTCSGKPYFPDARRPARQRALRRRDVGGDDRSSTARECFREIGGFVPHVMWDGIDCHRCRMLGWTARSFDDPELRFLHLRADGLERRTGMLGRALASRRRAVVHGHGAPVHDRERALPGHAAAAARAAAWRCGWGTSASMLARKPRYPDLEFRAYLRRYQRESLILGKRRGDRARGAAADDAPVAPLAVELEGVRLHALDEQQCVAARRWRLPRPDAEAGSSRRTSITCAGCATTNRCASATARRIWPSPTACRSCGPAACRTRRCPDASPDRT